jgi:hypothetical protein
VTAAPLPDRRNFDICGVVVSVSATDAHIRDAIERRLAAHARADAAAPAVTLDYRREPPAATPVDGRPIYDSQLGTVRYVEERDAIVLAGDGFDFECSCGTGVGVSRIAIGAERADWLASRPLLTLALLETLKRRGVFGVHAAAVEHGGRAVVIAGRSGAGKSTLALALGLHGFSFLGDDLVLLEPQDGMLRVAALCEELDLTEWTIAALPELASAAGPLEPGWPKFRVSPSGVFDDSVGIEATPGLILFPRRDPEQPAARAHPVPRGEALARLAPDILLTDRAAVAAHLSAVGKLVDESRCYELIVGAPAETAELVRSLA